MYEIKVTEREAEKPEIQLQVIVYFHADINFDSKSEELLKREETIRHLVSEALADEANDVAAWAYPEVRLAERTISRPGWAPITVGPGIHAA